MPTKNDLSFLKLAVSQAQKSADLGGFPAGAIIVKDDRIIARASALGNKINDPTSHPEIAAIKKACRKLKTNNLSGCTIYISMESCLMCFMADYWANISRIVYACRHSQVSSAYYGNQIDIRLINQQNLHPITLDFIPIFENEVLETIKVWENKIIG